MADRKVGPENPMPKWHALTDLTSLHCTLLLHDIYIFIQAIVSTINPPSQERTNKMPFSFWTAGCIYGATSVIAGAFGAHGLKSRGLPEAKIATWSTAAHYQVLWHTMAR